MKRKSFLFIIIVNISLTISAQFEIKSFYKNDLSNYFCEYYDDGLWGILYQDEVCLWPRFDELKQINYGIFLYKENGLWGVMCPTKKIIDPLFEECSVTDIKYGLYTSGISLITSKNNGKYGILGLSGTAYLENKYDSITAYAFNYFVSKKPKWQHKNLTYSGDIYFAVLLKGKWLLLDFLGNVICEDFNTNMSQKEKNSFGKFLEKYEINRTKTNTALKQDIKDKWRDEYYYKENIKSFFINKDFNKLGSEYGDTNNHIYETAFIDVPWLEDSTDAKLERDSTNLFFWRNVFFDSFPPLRKSYEFDETLDEDMLQYEIDCCEQLIKFAIGYMYSIECKGYSKESVLYKDALSISEHASQIIDTNIAGIKRVRRQKKLANIADMLNDIGTALGNTANTLNSIHNNNGTIPSYPTTSATDNSYNFPVQNSQNKFSISENQNKNTDSRTYANYDSMLSKMRSGLIPYNDSERRKWQSEMKKLRQKWQGKNFPHSQNENWNGK